MIGTMRIAAVESAHHHPKSALRIRPTNRWLAFAPDRCSEYSKYRTT